MREERPPSDMSPLVATAILAGVVSLFLVFLMLRGADAGKPAPWGSASAQPFVVNTPMNLARDGDWAVGAELIPGLYQTQVRPGVACVWTVWPNFSHKISEILAQDALIGPANIKVSLTAGVFSTNGCGTWSRIG